MGYCREYTCCSSSFRTDSVTTLPSPVQKPVIASFFLSSADNADNTRSRFGLYCCS